MASAIPDGVHLDSTILAWSSTVPVGLAILDAILVESGFPEASGMPPPASPFTLAAPMVLTPTTPIPMLVPRQTIVSPVWLEDPLRCRAAMTPPSCVLPETLITPEVEPVFIHVS
jgi:hypothetical protein